MDTVLGIEFGSTRIKAITVDKEWNITSSNSYKWNSQFENGNWTYSIDEALKGIRYVLSHIDNPASIEALGVSAMMHGYLAFDKNWNLLVPFRTWQNVNNNESAEILSKLFGVVVPQRWSISHVLQAMLNGEQHISQLAHVTTLASYIHFLLSGENVIGIGDASGMFPIDENTLDYNEDMINEFNTLSNKMGYKINIKDILPEIRVAGTYAGCLSDDGSKLIGGVIKPGIPLAPPEGDGQTGMVATNSVTPGTGNISAGTSIFTLLVIDKALEQFNKEFVSIMTPTGNPAILINGCNCTNDMNLWVGLLSETLSLFEVNVPIEELFTKLYLKSLDGENDCSGILTYNYLLGENIVNTTTGRPMIVRSPNSNLSLANFIRSQLYSTMVTLRIGMESLNKHNIKIDKLFAHGGLLKTPGVGQKYMAAAFNTPIFCLETAGEGGPYGMALLTSYLLYRNNGESLSNFLKNGAFSNVKYSVEYPDPEIVSGFNKYTEGFKKGLETQRSAIECITY